MEQLENLNVVAQELLVTPAQLKAELPVSGSRFAIRSAKRDSRSETFSTDSDASGF